MSSSKKASREEDPPAPEFHRVTMKDIAKLAGVHKTTVSLAMRNHPSIPESTRTRIREIANKVGYLPDPILGSFNFHRLSNHPVISAPSIAFISDMPSRVDFESSTVHHELYKGAKEQAENMGYIMERFFVGPGQLSPARLNRVLESRNISYVIVGAFTSNTTTLPLDWAKLCGLKIESFHVQPKLDVVTANHLQAARLAVQNLHKLGYRQIGLALTHDQDLRLANLFRAGYLVESRHTSEIELPILYTDDSPKTALGQKIHEWIFANQLDAIIAADNNIATCFSSHGHLIPPCIALTSLNVGEFPCNLAGILTNYRKVGARAVELMATSIDTNQRGLPSHISTTYVPVEWKSGSSAPSRNPRSHSQTAIPSRAV
jgi:LacI family transcriptional regulator